MLISKSSLALLFVTLNAVISRSALAQQHNIVFILTDDQDARMNSLDYMPALQKHLLSEGTHYRRHYCSVALCCPARVSLLTGKLSHNTNVTDVAAPYGGYNKFVSEGLNDNYLPLWVAEAGYNTYYTGKLMNFHSISNYMNPFPAGWTSSDFLLDPNTYEYFNGTWQRDRDEPVTLEGQYSTDVMTDRILRYIEDGAGSGSPFLAIAAPIAPHSNVKSIQTDPNNPMIPVETEPIPARRHEGLFANLTVPRSPNFNPDDATGASWMTELPKLNQTQIDQGDEWHRQRVRSMLAVDEMVDAIVQRLEELDILNNTFIVYTTDNGYHIGQHRLTPGKQCAIEEDLNVPLIVRGPGVPRGHVTDLVTSHTDLAPTFLDMLGINQREDFDGTPIPWTKESMEEAAEARFEHANLEHWGGVYGLLGVYQATTAYNTYKTVRIASASFNLLYTVYCDNQHALYDMNTDPYQIKNLLPRGNGTLPLVGNNTINGHSVNRIIPRLDALLMVLKTCQKSECSEPWSVIHPAGNVRRLEDALNTSYDDFYRISYEENRVSFSRCAFGHLLDAEGSLTPSVYGDYGDYETFAMFT